MLKLSYGVINGRAFGSGLSKLFNATQFDAMTTYRIGRIYDRCAKVTEDTMKQQSVILLEHCKLDEKGAPLFDNGSPCFKDEEAAKASGVKFDALMKQEIEIKVYKLQWVLLANFKGLTGPELNALFCILDNLPAEEYTDEDPQILTDADLKVPKAQ